jgi:hypothetical protein
MSLIMRMSFRGFFNLKNIPNKITDRIIMPTTSNLRVRKIYSGFASKARGRGMHVFLAIEYSVVERNE